MPKQAMPHPVLVARRLRENVRVGDEWRDDMPYALLAPSF